MSAPKKGTRFRSLQWRVGAKLAITTSILGIGVAAFIIAAFSKQATASLITRGTAISSLLADQLGPELEKGDKGAVSQRLVSLQTNSEFAFATVVRADGTQFVVLGTPPKQLSDGNPTTQNVTWTQDGNTLVVSTPIASNEKKGSVLRLGLSKEQTSLAIRKAILIGAGICFLVLLVMGGLFVFSLKKYVSTPISNLASEIANAVNGEMVPSEAVGTDVELEEFSEMRNTLLESARIFHENARSIQLTSSKVSMIADDIFASTSQLSKSAVKQVNILQEAGTTTKEVEISGQATRGNAKSILQAAEKSVKISKEGLQIVSESISQFHSVSENVKTIVTAVEALTDNLSKVDAIIASVANVAGLSQLLSVNASIEASKAEAAGLRFGVVAKEVKKLAAQSKSATDTIRATLSEIKSGIERIFEISEDGRMRTEQGLKSSENSGRIIERLANVINNTANEARQISSSIAEQVVGIDGLTGAVLDIEVASQANLVSVRDIETQGEKLRLRAKEMEEIAARFNAG